MIFVRYRISRTKLPVNWITLSFLFHTAMSMCYAAITLHGVADAQGYFISAFNQTEWGQDFGIGTDAIALLQYPLIHFFGLNWFACFLVYNLLGYIGIYLMFKVLWDLSGNNSKVKKIILCILFLPGMNYWTSSIGKDSLMMLGIGCLVYASQKWETRLPCLILGCIVAGLIRPHVCAVVVLSILLAFLFSKTRKWVLLKIILVVIGIGIGIASLSFLTKFVGVTELSLDMFEAKEKFYNSANSGHNSSVDISSYNIGEKMFLYLFRPLFFDAKNILMWIASIENLILLLFFINVLNRKNIRFCLKNQSFLIRFNVIYAISGTLLLSFACSNMGIAMRQKTMVLPSFFVIGIAAYANSKNEMIVEI